MWIRIKPILVGLAVSIVVLVVCSVALQLTGDYLSEERMAQWGIHIYLVGGFLMLLVPGFAAGYTAPGYGALYGALLAGLPIVLFSFVATGTPYAFYLFWLAVAAFGGYLGQVIAARRHAL